jgi:hypothetical protein
MTQIIDTPTTPTSTNGRTRRTLASQLDRLDAILNTLDARLHDSIASAVEQAVGTAVEQAVRAVLTEVLTNPELQQQLQPVSPPAPAPEDKPQAPKGPVGKLWEGVCEKTRQAWAAVKQTWSRVGTRVKVGALAFAGAAGTLTYLFRSRVASAAGCVWGWACGLVVGAGRVLGRMASLVACGT